MSKNIAPINKKGNPCGYWEIYYDNGILRYKGKWIDGERVGIHIWWEDITEGVIAKYYII